MNAARLLTGAGGVVVAVVSVVVALFGGFTGLVAGLVSAFGNDYLLVSAFGIVGVAAAAVVQVLRARSGLEQATPPSVEAVHAVPRLGADVDAFLDPAASPAADAADPDRVRTALRELAVSLEARGPARSRREARRRVDDGDWTDDDVAAAYLSDVGSIPRRERSIAGLRGESAAQFGARRAALELDRRVRDSFDVPGAPAGAPVGGGQYGRPGEGEPAADRSDGAAVETGRHDRPRGERGPAVDERPTPGESRDDRSVSGVAE